MTVIACNVRLDSGVGGERILVNCVQLDTVVCSKRTTPFSVVRVFTAALEMVFVHLVKSEPEVCRIERNVYLVVLVITVATPQLVSSHVLQGTIH